MLIGLNVSHDWNCGPNFTKKVSRNLHSVQIMNCWYVLLQFKNVLNLVLSKVTSGRYCEAVRRMLG